MIKKFFTIITVLLFALMVLPLLQQVVPFEELTPVAAAYAEQGPDQLGAANLVTSVIVTYRGLDTLGEVTVLFIATAGVGFFSAQYNIKIETDYRHRRGGVFTAPG